MEAAINKMEEAYQADIEAYRNEQMKEPYDEETAPRHIDSESDPQAVP